MTSCFGGKAIIEEDPFLQKWRLKAETSKGHSPTLLTKTIDIPEKENEKVVPEKKEEVVPIEKENPLPTKKITLKMNNVDMVVALRALARAANQNILMNPDEIKGNTSIHLVDIPWNQAFVSILNTRKLTYEIEGEILRVMTLKEKEDLLDKETELMAKKKKVKQLEPLLPPKVIPINYADASKIREILIKLLDKKLDKEGADGKEPHGSITVHEHTNALVIQAPRGKITELVELINQLDRPTAQILIEAYIVEATKEIARELGVQWGGSLAQTTSANFPNTIQLSGGLDPNLIVNFPADLSTSGGAALGLTLGSLTGAILLDAQLSALEKEGKLTILSRPSITTLDNQEAFTLNGTEVPFVSLATTGGSTIQKVEYKKAVLKLEITPHVIDGKNLKMKIKITNDEVDMSRNVLGNPFILKKETKTTLIVQDGHTIVIAGLTKETKSGTINGVPWFADIPWLGWLFKRDKKSDKKEEVLIFITPHILKEEGKEITH